MFLSGMLNAVICIIQRRNLKKQFNRAFSRCLVSALQKSYAQNSFIGVIFMSISIIIGIVWGLQIIGLNVLYDPKVIGTICVIIMYTIILALVKMIKDTPRFAVYSIAIFVLVMLNYLIVSELSNFHFWSL